MKHLYMTLFIGILLAGCAIEELPVEDILDDDVVFASGVRPDSKVSFSMESDAVRLKWMKGDEIGIYSMFSGEPDAENVKYLAKEFDYSSTFSYASPHSRIKWKNDTDPHSFYAYYPYNDGQGNGFSEVSVDVPAVQIQNGANNMDHISACNFMWACVEYQKQHWGWMFPISKRKKYSIMKIIQTLLSQILRLLRLKN